MAYLVRYHYLVLKWFNLRSKLPAGYLFCPSRLLFESYIVQCNESGALRQRGAELRWHIPSPGI